MGEVCEKGRRTDDACVYVCTYIYMCVCVRPSVLCAACYADQPGKSAAEGVTLQSSGDSQREFFTCKQRPTCRVPRSDAYTASLLPHRTCRFPPHDRDILNFLYSQFKKDSILFL